MSILVDHNYRRCEVKKPGDRIKRITEADLAASAIPAIIAETAASVREKFMEEARHTKCKELYLHNRVRRNMVEAVFENAVNQASHAGDDIDMSEAADYLEIMEAAASGKKRFLVVRQERSAYATSRSSLGRILSE
jgi:hypothetical protein